jgi:hypothetical protein
MPLRKWITFCPTCHSAIANLVIVQGQTYSFTCICGAAMGGPEDQLPASLRKVAPTPEDKP